MPPSRGQRTGKRDKNARRHSLDRLNASMIKQKKILTLPCPACHPPHNVIVSHPEWVLVFPCLCRSVAKQDPPNRRKNRETWPAPRSPSTEAHSVQLVTLLKFENPAP